MKILSRALTTGLMLSAVIATSAITALCTGLAHAREGQPAQQPRQIAAVTSRQWKKIPGKASDIAMGGDKVWVLGVDTVKGGHSIFRYNGKGWDKIPGAATAIAVDSDGVPWVCQDNYNIYQRVGDSWSRVPGKAFQVAIGGEQVWVLGTNHSKDGYDVYRYARGSWEKVAGAGVAIAADPDGVPWVCTEDNSIRRRLQDKWESMPGKATQVGIGGESVWALGVNATSGGHGIYRWARGEWEQNSGGAKRIAVGSKQVWVINDKGDIFCSDL